MENVVSYSNKFRKLLFDKINILSSTEHEEIFRIISKYNIDFTQNKNGIFFNISAIDDEIIKEIDCFVTYSLNNSKELDEYDKKLNECKINQKFDNMVCCHNQFSSSSLLNSNNNNNTPNDFNNSVKVGGEIDWAKILNNDAKKMKNVTTFVDMMNQDRDKICKKKINVKFYNAQKKYSKKYMTDKKIVDFSEELQKEEY